MLAWRLKELTSILAKMMLVLKSNACQGAISAMKEGCYVVIVDVIKRESLAIVDVWRNDIVVKKQYCGDSKSVMMKLKWKEARCDGLNTLIFRCCSNQEAGPEVDVSGNMC